MHDCLKKIPFVGVNMEISTRIHPELSAIDQVRLENKYTR